MTVRMSLSKMNKNLLRTNIRLRKRTLMPLLILRQLQDKTRYRHKAPRHWRTRAQESPSRESKKESWEQLRKNLPKGQLMQKAQKYTTHKSKNLSTHKSRLFKLVMTTGMLQTWECVMMKMALRQLLRNNLTCSKKVLMKKRFAATANLRWAQMWLVNG